MIYLVLTHSGFEQVAAEAIAGDTLWLNTGLLQADEQQSLEARELRVVVSRTPINPKKDRDIFTAMDEIERRFRGEEVLVEYP
ncbi:hypothetical protein [Biformimicrobium ophioploci]|uniref:Uncharacterized protein n=1 Tax=Biformimicrobium ophioploci TaxID=3036711 RepID=A0ABQ6LUF7_9GAMM|nr:hypothetical protein [Microbulbifer sp. NKW57]GMG85696.1 hypothetical protein MNKW57_00170 [Microbulbifer sp. NKW57]